MSGHIEGDLRQKVPSLIRTDSWPVTLLISVRLTVIERNRNSWRSENFCNWNNYWYYTGWDHVLKSYREGLLINHKKDKFPNMMEKLKVSSKTIQLQKWQLMAEVSTLLPQEAKVWAPIFFQINICECVRSNTNFHPRFRFNQNVDFGMLEMFLAFNVLNMTRTNGWIQKFSHKKET